MHKFNRGENMEKTLTELHEWLNSLLQFSLPNWKAIPDLDLYMDQVITYLERELMPLAVEDKEKIITAWMINNYVKGNLLPPPIQKKYSKEHLGYMFAICAIKQVLSISDIARLFSFENITARKPEELYEFLRTTQLKIINDIVLKTTNDMEELLNNSLDEVEIKRFLNNFVYKLAIEAEVKKIIADKIMYLVSKNEAESRLEQERLEKERLEKEKQERLDKERLEKERLEKEKQEKSKASKKVNDIIKA